MAEESPAFGLDALARRVQIQTAARDRAELDVVQRLDGQVVRAAPDSGPSPSPWRPIETAPKDGTTMLAWGPGWVEPEIVCWNSNEPEPGWQEGPGGDFVGLGWEPTHWMPLPEPPGVEDGR